MPLSSFSPRVGRWFEQAFAAPTSAQAKAWPAIAAGDHVLLSAPTGSGKTLAAFLWALDRLSTHNAEVAGPSPRQTRVVYVSPLKALAYDIERNLRTPLRGIGAEEVSVGIRTGDTPQRERAAMARNPPDILITTPESLYLILTSHARRMLSGVEAVIVDEIHAVAHSKRGSHLALTLERLEAQARSARRSEDRSAPSPADAAGDIGRGAVQRIGLSATQNPLEEIGRYLVGPRRRVTIIDAGAQKKLDLRIEVPVDSMTEPGGPVDPRAGPARARPGRRVDALVDLAGDLPPALGAGEGPQLDDRVRQQPPLGRARGAAAERAGRCGDRARPPRLARPRGAHEGGGAAQGG